MGQRSWRRWLVIGALALVALGAAFVAGRLSAPDAAATGPDCSKAQRYQIGVPAQFGATGWFSLCEQTAAFGKRLGDPASPVKIYARATGSKVVAWFYPDCDGLDGVLPVGTKHPAVCAGSGTTATSADATPAGSTP